MSISSLLNAVLEVLKTDTRLVSEDGELLKNKTQELAYTLDPSLIGLLLRNPLTKERFFREIEWCLIFDQEAFVSFVMSKDFLPDSYTRYKNFIWLNIDGKTLDERKEVSLVWAYKDCVLAGGQDKEDAKRGEIFYNETLGSDQIDRLLDPKVFTEFKRIDKDGKHDLESFRKDEHGNIKDNLIIKGNNLLALHSLKKKFKGQIKLIYIDPPYNTGTDSFQYNDRFNHSSWLTFIKNRLEIAHELLAKDWSIFVSIDHNEIGYMVLLLDTVFWSENKQNIITIKRWSITGHKTINQGAVNLAEYILVYAKDWKQWNPNRVFIERERNVRYNNFIKNRQLETDNWEFCSLLDAFAEKHKINKKDIRKTFGEWIENAIFDFILENADAVIQFAYPDEDKVSIEAKALIQQSKNNPKKVFHLKRENEPDIYLINWQRILFYSDRLIKIDWKFVTWELVSDIWLDVLPNDLHNEGWVTLKKWKKPERMLHRILELWTNESDLILDFFWWSGTSWAVAHKMNRQYILTEQMDYIHDLPEQRLINVINGDKTGISKTVWWEWGGDFVYMEIACDAERYIEMIRDAETTDMLIEIWGQLKTKSFVNYKLDPQSIDNTLEDFKKLSLEEQKRILIDTIDKNALYKNLSEMDDANSEVSEADKRLNHDFYN